MTSLAYIPESYISEIRVSEVDASETHISEIYSETEVPQIDVLLCGSCGLELYPVEVGGDCRVCVAEQAAGRNVDPFNVDPYDIDFYDALYPLSDLDYPDMDAIAAADDRMAEAADDRMVAAAMCR